MEKVQHEIVLSTTDPNNDIGNLKIRQADEETQILETQITEKGQPKNYEGLQAFFCAKLGQSDGLGIVEQKLKEKEMTNPVKGRLAYTIRSEDWQQVGRQVGYFSFRKMKDDHTFVEQFSTRDFYFTITPGIYSKGVKEVKKDGSTYIWTVEDLLRLFKEYIAAGKTNWEEFVEQNKEIIESVDPGGILLNRLGIFNDFRPFDYEVIKKMQNEFTERSLNARWYGVKADGITDDTEALKVLIGKARDGSKIIFPKNSTIVLSEPLIIKKSNLTFDFNGSTLSYVGTQDLGEDNGRLRSYSALTIQGESLKETETAIKSLKSYEGIVDKNFFTTGDRYNGLTNPLTDVSRIGLKDTSQFKINDYVEVNIKNYKNYDWDKSYLDNPATINLITRIIYVDEQYIYADFANHFKFDADKINGSVTKIDPLKNITVLNLNFEDNNDSNVPSEVTVSDRNSWVGGIKANYVTNLTIQNFTASKFRFPAISTNFVYNLKIDNVKAFLPRVLTAGCGYGMQIVSSLFGSIENITGEFVRHLIDFSRSGQINVRKAKMPNDWHASFDCHGNGEFGITFEDTVGNIVIGNGIAEFPEMVDDVKVSRHVGGFKARWARQVDITDSTLFMDPQEVSKCPYFKMRNCDLIFKRTDRNFVGVTRGAYTGTYFKLEDCHLEILNENNPYVSATSRLFEIDGYDWVSIQLKSSRNFRDAMMRIVIAKCNKVDIKNSKINNLGLTITDEVDIAGNLSVDENLSLRRRTVRIINTDFNLTKDFNDVGNIININNEKEEGNIVLYLKNATVDNQAKKGIRWLRSRPGNAKLYVNATDNYISGNVLGWSEGDTRPIMIATQNNLDHSTGDEPTGLKNYNKDFSVVLPKNAKEIYVNLPDRIYPYKRPYHVILNQIEGQDLGSYYLNEKTGQGFKINVEKSSTIDITLYIKILVQEDNF